MQSFSGIYLYSLNSSDLFDPGLPLARSTAHGGTMVMWRIELDPYITVIPSSCPAFLPVLFKPPGQLVSIHVAIYLPTQGQENEFIDCISKLSLCVEQLQEQYPGAALYLRGDFNVNDNNKNRNTLLEHLCSEHLLKSTPISHKTYHHFTGGGLSDSNLDKLLFSSSLKVPETVLQIICKLENPLINSHHDLILSSWSLPPAPAETSSSSNITAPRIENQRTKTIWSDTGILNYQELIHLQLHHLQNLWLASPSRSCISVFMKTTNDILKSAAAKTNKIVDLATKVVKKPKSIPKTVKKSQRNLLYQSREVDKALSNDASDEVVKYLKNKIKVSKTEHQKLVRFSNAQESIKRDEKLHMILTKTPSALYRCIRSNNNISGGSIRKLTVRDRLYLGDTVADGFFDSLHGLKSLDHSSLSSSESFVSFAEDFENILEICDNGEKIPQITRSKSDEILMNIKPMVSDLYSITSSHYINAGEIGLQHFFLLLSALISDISNINITEINAVFATILFKGHDKDKNSDRSYRTISICPLVAKALDLYIRELNLSTWMQDQAEVQFMGEGSSHELAALLLTETLQTSLYSARTPLYALFLDAMSAFDSVLRKILINDLYHCGTDGHSLLFINSRLENRTTFVEYDKELMGPIADELGVEQGGANSGDYYKVFGKAQLSTAQASNLGVSLGNQTISAIGQADDTVLLSNCLHSLQNLLKLSLEFCSKHHIQLCVEKTKLIAISNPSMAPTIEYSKLTSPVQINGTKIPFSSTVEHVGILRNESSNLPHIMSRIKAHQKALGAVLHAGAARHHRGNPAGSLRIEKLYALPRLFSGLGVLVLLKTEVDMIDHHIKETQEKLMRLHPRTPQCVVSFLAGCLPGRALLHQKILSIFGMICVLKDSILHCHAKQVLVNAKPSSRSWFVGVRDICLQYGLPHPLELLNSERTKEISKP